ncbi:unnamed protein product [Meloidogyne enterolobii]|uniref:Uncharacterized protein n=1 Tax=Meloidogyne enterolobii TaxID=390850 RepID=A0ACB0YUR0_MELEN
METLQIREGVRIPPQIREFYIQYPPPRSVGESSQQASGRRRRRNGNGGNGQHGGGRGRYN